MDSTLTSFRVEELVSPYLMKDDRRRQASPMGIV